MSEFHQVAALFVTIIATARITRLITFDVYPPAAWLRMKWDDLVPESSGWNVLFHCGYCMGPWVGLLVGGVGYFSDWHFAWWCVTLWLTVGYLGAVTMAYDGED